MAFRATKCPACQKAIQVPDDIDVSCCMYCGQSIEVKDIIQITMGPNIDNLLGMARTASQAGNSAEAMSYYNRVLELDPTVSEAWIGKGKAAGWASSLSNMRFNEMILAFSHAVGTAPEGEKSKLIAECVNEANKLVATLYGIAREHMITYVALPNSWGEYLVHVGQMLDALDTVHNWDVTDRITLENIIHLCKDNIEGITYRDPYQNNVSKAWHLSPQYESMMRSRIDSAVAMLQDLDPSYSAPIVEVKKPDACFVVTATMGDADHPTVKFMRLFRDEWIMKKSWGADFVDAYYKFGPVAARFIESRNWLRKVAFIIIVSPAAWIAKRLLR